MKSITYEEFLKFRPCYLHDPEKKALMDSIAQRNEHWTALDILGLEEIPDEDKLWCVLREEVIDPKTLHEFACACAERALSRLKNPDPRSVAAIAAKRAWMHGEITDEELTDARAAASDAACDVAKAAVCDAAWAAACDAAWVAACNSVRGAARAAARDAVSAAASAAAWDAAWAAERAAAGDAAGGRRGGRREGRRARLAGKGAQRNAEGGSAMKDLNVSGGWELPCYDGRKSFYGKAKVKLFPRNEKVLLSYGTPVCGISQDGSFHRYWPGYSATTMRHVNSFLSLFGLPGGGKAWWDALPIEDAPNV